jgi:hypothetical protein
VKVTAIPVEEAECDERGGALVQEEGSSAGVEVCAGEPGEPGDPWTAGGTLPVGATETGSFSLSGTFPAFPEGFLYATASFSIPLAAPLDEEHVIGLAPGYNGEDEVGAEHENCPGTSENPRAKSGYLCVYTSLATFLLVNKPAEIRRLSGGAGASKSGALLVYAKNANPGYSSVAGTFALTG